MRWLRTQYVGPLQLPDEIEPCHVLRGLRDDGQLFVVWIPTNGENVAAIRRDLRDGLDSKINDPQTPPYVNEETGESFSSQCQTDCFKGCPGWVEEDAST